jgi:hypothetical protein
MVTLLVTAGCSFLLGRLIATSFCLVSSSLKHLIGNDVDLVVLNQSP